MKNTTIHKSLTFSPAGFSSGRPDPTLVAKQPNIRGFTFLRLFRDCYAWLSLVLNSLVNEKAILTHGFYVQEWNCLLTVFSEQPLIRIIKEQVSLVETVYYTTKEIEFIPQIKDLGVFLRLNLIKKFTIGCWRYNLQ